MAFLRHTRAIHSPNLRSHSFTFITVNGFALVTPRANLIPAARNINSQWPRHDVAIIAEQEAKVTSSVECQDVTLIANITADTISEYLKF